MYFEVLLDTLRYLYIFSVKICISFSLAACLNLIGRLDFYYYSAQVFDQIQVFLL